MLLWLVLACVLRYPELAGVTIDAVDVTELHAAQAGMLLGVSHLRGTLEITDQDGVVHVVPIRGSGPSAGLLFTVSQSTKLPWGEPTERFVIAPETEHARQLFGLYKGSSLSAAWVLGVERYELSNRHGTFVSRSGAAAGFGLWMGGSWMWIRPAPRRERGAPGALEAPETPPQPPITTEDE